MIGETFIAPISRFDSVEGSVVHFDENTGFVVLITDEGELWSGYEYQLESIEEG